MKLIKLSEDHYVVVDESEFKQNVFVYNYYHKRIETFLAGAGSGLRWQITHSTQPIEEWKSVNYGGDGTVKKKIYNKIKELPLQEVKELLSEVDVEKQVDDYGFQVPYDGSNNFYDKEKMKHYLAGYNQALEDNKGKVYTEENMRKAIDIAKDSMGVDNDGETCYSHLSTEQIIEVVLQPKTEWNVEIVGGKLKLI